MPTFNAFTLVELSEVLLDILIDNDFKREILSGKISPAQGRIFSALAQRHPKGFMLKELAQELHLTPGAVSQSVERLVADGTVIREVSATDRRAVSVRITSKGLQLKENNDRRLGELLSLLLKDISEKDRIIFQQVASQALQEGKRLRKESLNEILPEKE